MSLLPATGVAPKFLDCVTLFVTQAFVVFFAISDTFRVNAIDAAPRDQL